MKSTKIYSVADAEVCVHIGVYDPSATPYYIIKAGTTFDLPEGASLDCLAVPILGGQYQSVIISEDGSVYPLGNDSLSFTQNDAFFMGVIFSVPVFGYCIAAWVLRRGLGIGSGGLSED